MGKGRTSSSVNFLRSSLLLALVVLATLAAVPREVLAQAGVGTEYVTFWRGDLRIIATRDSTEVTLYDVDTGLPLAPALWTGSIATNPFVLNAGDSFEGLQAVITNRVRVRTQPAGGPIEDKPVVVFTGRLATTLIHPPAPPANQNAWLSYLPDLVQSNDQAGSELGSEFLGFVSRDMWIFVRSRGMDATVTIEDLITNVETDSDDSLTMDRSSPYLVYTDGDVDIYKYSEFEDDTVRVTTDAPASVLVGLTSAGVGDWAMTPPSYGFAERGRELGTLFYTYVTDAMAIYPVFDNTTITVTDLSDGDDSYAFNLVSGHQDSANYDIYLSQPAGTGAGQLAVGRGTGPAVNILVPPNAPFEDDLVKVESDRPILVYVGPVASNLGEFADVSYSVPVGPSSQLIYSYAQNGGVNDFQMFSRSDTNAITITSLSYTSGFRAPVNHDWSIPLLTPFQGGNATTADWYWSDGGWSAELLRVEADSAVQVMTGDYDAPNFGAFIPFLTRAVTSPPVADAGPDLTVCPGTSVVLNGTNSFDSDFQEGPEIPFWTWDLDASVDSDGDTLPQNDVDGTGPLLVFWPPPGTTTITLTYTDDEGESSSDVVVVRAEDVNPPVVTCSQQLFIEATDPLGALASPAAVADDECDPNPGLVNDRTDGGAEATDWYPCGVTAVTFTATDDAGLSATCTTVVAVSPALGSLPPMGPVLRVGKAAANVPRLDWSLSGGAPSAPYAVVRYPERVQEPPTTHPNLDQLTWDDPDPNTRLVFYEVVTWGCLGTRSED